MNPHNLPDPLVSTEQQQGILPPEQLFYAVQNRDLALVATLLKDPTIDVNWQNPDLHLATPLHCSCFYNIYPAFQLLLADPRVKLNLRSEFGSTPFSLGCFNNCLPIVKDLLRDPRTDLNMANDRGETPLWRAVHSGNVEVIKWMLACGAKVDTTTASNDSSPVAGTTPAQLARVKNYPDLATVLEEYEVNHEKIRFQLRLLLDFPVECAAAIFAIIVLFCDDYLQVAPFWKYQEERETQWAHRIPTDSGEYKDPFKGSYPMPKIASKYPALPTPSTGSQAPKQAGREIEEGGKEEEALDRKYVDTVRFVRIAQRLPLELQMILCNRACHLSKTIIRNSVTELAFKNLIISYNESKRSDGSL